MQAAQSLIFEEIFIEEKQLIKVKWEELKERIFVTLLIQQKVVFEMNFLCFHTKRRRPLLNRNFLREKYSLWIKCAPQFWHISHQRTFTTLLRSIHSSSVVGLSLVTFVHLRMPKRRVVGNLSLVI